MIKRERFYQKPGFWRWASAVGLFIVFLMLFKPEVAVIRSLFDQQPPLTGRGELILSSFFKLAWNIGANLFFFGLFLFLIAQFVLPVRTSREHSNVFNRMINYLMGWRGPAVFVRDGKYIAKKEELQNVQPGVIFVDSSSAVLIERQSVWWSPESTSPLDEDLDNIRQPRPNRAKVSKNGRPMKIRVEGPGVIFTEPGEKIKGVVDLRKQFRINLGVKASTADGIEVETNVFVLFTLGQPPDIQRVAYVGSMTPDDLRVITVEREMVPDPRQMNHWRYIRKIKSIEDQLDPDDKAEIHRYAQRFLYSNEPGEPLPPDEKPDEHPPYLLDKQRIFNAVYSAARKLDGNEPVEWTDLPTQVATEVFRSQLGRVTYDWLYHPEVPAPFPLVDEFKPGFARNIRNLGVMSYVFLHRCDGAIPRMGQVLDEGDFRFSPVQELRQPKVLRERGIKVVHAGFSQLKPTSPKVREQRLDNWRAQWQREAAQTKADLDLEVTKIIGEARSLAQRQMIHHLAKIMDSPAGSEDAIAFRITEALVGAAADPATKRLLPKDTVQMLINLQTFLASQDTGEGSGYEARTGPKGGLPDKEGSD